LKNFIPQGSVATHFGWLSARHETTMTAVLHRPQSTVETILFSVGRYRLKQKCTCRPTTRWGEH